MVSENTKLIITISIILGLPGRDMLSSCLCSKAILAINFFLSTS